MQTNYYYLRYPLKAKNWTSDVHINKVLYQLVTSNSTQIFVTQVSKGPVSSFLQEGSFTCLCAHTSPLTVLDMHSQILKSLSGVLS